MNITDIRKIIREELSEGDVIDFKQAKIQRGLRQELYSDLITLTNLTMQSNLQDPREALAIQRNLTGKDKDKFLNYILTHLYKVSDREGSDPWNFSRLRKRHDISKKYSLTKTEELHAVHSGIYKALVKTLGPDPVTPDDPRSYLRSADDPRELEKKRREAGFDTSDSRLYDVSKLDDKEEEEAAAMDAIFGKKTAKTNAWIDKQMSDEDDEDDDDED